MLLGDGVQYKQGLMALLGDLGCLGWRLIEDDFRLRFFMSRWLSKSCCAASVTQPSPHSSFLAVMQAFLSFLPENDFIRLLLLLSVEDAHVTLQRAREI